MITTIEKICQQCGESFHTPTWRIKHGRGKFCSVQCFNQFQVGKSWLSPEAESKAQKISYQQNPIRAINNRKIMKGLWGDPEYRKRFLSNRDTPETKRKHFEGNSIAAKRMWQNPESRRKNLQSRKLAYQDPAYRAKISERFNALWQDPNFRAKVLKAREGISQKRWQNPEFVAKVFAGLNKKPNKSEQRLIDIFAERLPQFKYNGDFSLGVTLSGLIPDFVNVNGKKEVIELFGDYFHSTEVIGADWRRSELGKAMLYNSLGWKCLVIWESELKKLSEDEILQKVASFFKNKRKEVHHGIH